VGLEKQPRWCTMGGKGGAGWDAFLGAEGKQEMGTSGLGLF